VLDLGSAAGTFINGERLAEETTQRLRPGDTITYGSCRDDAFIVVDCGAGNERVERAREKLLRLQLESERIRSKEGSEGLTSGQERVLEKNEQEIRQLEKTIFDGLNSGKQSNSGSAPEVEEDQFWDAGIAEDDGITSTKLLDLTEKKPTKGQTVQTYDSLVRRIAELDGECSTLNTQIAALAKEREDAENGDDEDVDELDRFMAANENDIKSGDLEKAQKKLRDAQEERVRCQRLADIARPALSKALPFSSGSTFASKTNQTSQSHEGSTRLSPASAPTIIPAKSKVDQIFARSSPATSTANPAQQAAKFRLVHERVDIADDEGNNSKRGKQLNDKDESSEDASWKPPVGQRGDGKTSINEKFGY
jgi:hypothetical protein